MARKLVCQPQDELEQAVLAPRSFESVPPHTSCSVEGRRTTIKGHSVYLNLPVSACQMFHSLSFISAHKLCFIFTPFFCSCSTFYSDEKRGKVRFLVLQGETAEIRCCFICFRKAG